MILMIMSAEDEREVSCRFTRAAAFNARDRLMAGQLILIDSRDTTLRLRCSVCSLIIHEL